jgi:hypothetical protein
MALFTMPRVITAAGLNGVTLSTSGHKVAVLTSWAEADDTITHVGCVIVGFTSGGNLVASIEGVSTSAVEPDGVPLGSGTIAVSATGYVEVALTTPVAVTMGQRLAVVFTNSTGSYQLCNVQDTLPAAVWPTYTVNTGSWSATGRELCATVRCDTTYSVVPGLLPIGPAALSAQSLTTSSSPRQAGNEITLARAERVIGAWARVTGAATADFAIKLYAASDVVTPLRTSTHDASAFFNTSGIAYLYFTSPLEASAGAVLPLVAEATTANARGIARVGIVSASARTGMPYVGQCRRIERNDTSSAFTTDDTQLALMGLIVDPMYAPAGGGSGGYSRARVVNS